MGSAHEQELEQLVQRRAAAEPMAYILGEREFYGRMFSVDRRALIPRPETELLVELGMAAVDRLRGMPIDPRVLEIGTGSGAVAVSLAAERSVKVACHGRIVRGPAARPGQRLRARSARTNQVDPDRLADRAPWPV